MRIRKSWISGPLEVLLRCVMSKSNDTSFLIECDEAGTDGEHIFDLRNIIYIKDLVAKFDGKGVLKL